MFTGIVSDIGVLLARDGGKFQIGCHYPPSSLGHGGSIACDGCCLTVTHVGVRVTSESSRPSSNDPEAVRQWIAAICQRTGLTPTQLAKEARLAVTTVTRFVNEKDGAQANLGGTTLSKLTQTASRLLPRETDTVATVFEVDVSNETLSRTTLFSAEKGARFNLERPLAFGEELGGHLVTGHVDGKALIRQRIQDGASVRFLLEPPPELTKYIASKGSVALNGVSLTVNKVDGRAFGVNIIPHTLTHTTWGALEAGDLVNLEVDLLARYVERTASVERAARQDQAT